LSRAHAARKEDEKAEEARRGKREITS